MIRDYINYLIFRAIIFLCHCLPGRFLYWVALRLADLNFYVLDRRGREAVKANLRQVLPEASEERIHYEARWVFRNFGKYLSEFFRFRSFGKEFFRKHVAIRGREYVDDTIRDNKSVILLSAHLSNWELGAAAFRMMWEKDVHVVAAMHRYGRVNDLFMRERESMGISVIDAKDAPRQVLRVLKEGGLVGILGDRDPTEQGVEVDFFGKPCRFPQGPARFSIATGAPIVPGFVLRRTNDSFTIVFAPPIYPPDTGTREEKVKAITQKFASVFEDAVRWHPEEWGVFYRVWEETWRM